MQAVQRIKAMPRELGNEIRAPAIISALHTMVEELVMNSLDADSRRIHVGLDFDLYGIEVRDDGKGIDLTKASSTSEGNFGSGTAAVRR